MFAPSWIFVSYAPCSEGETVLEELSVRMEALDAAVPAAVPGSSAEDRDVRSDDVTPLLSITAHAVVLPTTAELLPKVRGSSGVSFVVLLEGWGRVVPAERGASQELGG